MVDLYPTLVELCGLPLGDGLEGDSFLRLLDEPELEWKRAVFSQFPRSYKSNRHRSHGDVMGYALRTQRYRFIQWRDWKSQRVVEQELYDHSIDAGESMNVVAQKKYAETATELSKKLLDGWVAARPQPGVKQ